MKIVHLGDSDSGGGAAHAMSRLHGALQRLGVDSRLLVRNTAAPGNGAETVATRGDADDLFPAVRDAVVRQYVELNRTSVSNTHFSLHIDGADVSRVPLVAASDVVHLHWTASFQTPADVRALFDAKPVVWTLHDLEPLTGGCHFPAGCEGYAVDDCGGCPQLARDPFGVTATTLRDKTTLWAGGRPTFVAPSRYMAERARRSAVARHAEASVVHIPHGIDVDAFRAQPKAAARRALGVPVDGLYVLCGSSHNAEKRKGLAVLGRVLAAAKARWQLSAPKLTLLTIGEPKLDLHEIDGTDVIQLGRVSPAMMPSVYAAADVLLHPAAEDNFPLMLLESSSCGTPVIAFDVGGVADIVQDEVGGRLIAAGDELAMAEALSSLVSEPRRLQRLADGARAHVEEHFSDTSVARKHAELYDEVVANRAASRAPASARPPSGIEQIFPRWSAACLVEELAFARERAAMLTEGSRANAARIAGLEREGAALAANLAEQTREVREKDAELIAVHEVADERKRLAETLHASAADLEALAVTLQSAVRERDALRAELEATLGEQRAEIALVHRVAADRAQLIEDLHRVAEERTAAAEREAAAVARSLAEQHRHVLEKEAELSAVHAVADERKRLAETLHAAAASIEASAASLQRAVRERDGLLAQLGATTEEQRAEIELVHRIAADRAQLIGDLERVAEERQAAAARLQRDVGDRDDRLAQLAATFQEQRAEIGLVHQVAAERGLLIDGLARVAEERQAAAASVEASVASLLRDVRERDERIVQLAAASAEQRAEIVLVHHVAADRARLIDDLQRVAEERLALIDRLAALAEAPVAR